MPSNGERHLFSVKDHPRSLVERGWFWIVTAASIIAVTATLTWGAALSQGKLETKEQHEADVAPMKKEIKDHRERMDKMEQYMDDNRENWRNLFERLDGMRRR